MNKLIIPPTLVAYSLILIVLFYFVLPTYNIIPFPFNLGGLILVFMAVSVTGKARDLHKKYATTLKISESSHLINEGIFTKTRNPMYLGMSLLLLGIGICFGNLFSMIIPLIFAVVVSIVTIPKEEKLLDETFGEEYVKYKKEVRRWI